MVPATATVSIPPVRRLASLDVLRGLIMILMTLDHVRDFFSGARFSPLDLAHTTPALFLTRWITHFCAPGFVFLAGMSAYLWASSRGKSKAQLAGFLFWRGLWLILLELTLVRLAWFLELDYAISLAQVIWAIGWSMLALAGMVLLPDWLILSIAILMIGGHNLLDRFLPTEGFLGAGLWNVLHRPGLIEILPGYSLYVLYPLLPWPGVMALGYIFGRFYKTDPSRRSKWFLRIGSVFLLAFGILRALNLYGDPGHWFPQRNGIFTLLSFINLEKYPPSLLFLLLMLGGLLIALGFLERSIPPFLHFAAIFGRVPLLYYILHLFVIHLAAVGLAWLRYGRADWLFGSAWLFREGFPPDYGYGLAVVYGIWALVVVCLFPVTQWFAHLKQSRSDWWLELSVG